MIQNVLFLLLLAVLDQNLLRTIAADGLQRPFQRQYNIRRNTVLEIEGVERTLQQQQSPPIPPLELDRKDILSGITGDDNAKKNWADSYSVGEECFCDSSYDHNISTVMVRSPLFPNEISILKACELIGPGPGNFEIDPRPIYNDIQCGNGPPNNAGDENTCPGRVEYGASGCSSIGPTWNWKKAFPYDTITVQDGYELKDLLDFKYIHNTTGQLVSVDVLLDVRSVSEFDAGHIENATLMENLASFVIDGANNNSMTTASDVSIANPADIIGCQYCTIVVYCRSGARASVAIEILRQSGFKGQLINGLGIAKWTEAGYPLVSTASIEAPCALVDSRASIICTERWLSYQQPTPPPSTETMKTPAPVLSQPPPFTAVPMMSASPTLYPVTLAPITLVSPTLSPVSTAPMMQVLPTSSPIRMVTMVPVVPEFYMSSPTTTTKHDQLNSNPPTLLPSFVPSVLTSQTPSTSKTNVPSDMSSAFSIRFTFGYSFRLGMVYLIRLFIGYLI